MVNSSKVFIMSYKKNGKWNKTLSPVKKRFKEKGFDVSVIRGYYLPEHPEIKKTHLVYRNVLDKVIPKAKKYLKENPKANGFYIAEDDAWLNKSIDDNYLKKKIKSKKNLLRVGYQKVLKEDKLPRGYFCVGAQLTWVPRSQMVKFEKSMKTTQPQHFNGFLSKTKKINIKLMKQDMRNKIVNELQHMSFTMGKVRKGVKL